MVRVKNELYADLPDDLLEEIIQDAPRIAEHLKPLFDELLQNRRNIQDKLEESNLIRNASELENPSSPSVSGIDGGQAIDKALGADTLIAVAVGVEGLVREDKRKWSGIQHKNWQTVLSHHSQSNSKIVRGAMTALELLIISQAPHDVIIADGSHQSPVIGINSLTSMSTLDDPVHAKTMFDIIHDLDVVVSLKKSMENQNVVYMVKYDSSQDIGLTALQDFDLKVDDKTVMSLVLRPNEFTKPLQVGQTHKTQAVWSSLNISLSQKLDCESDIRNNLKSSLNEAIKIPKNRKIYFTYYKPYDWSPAYRIEIKEQCARSEYELAKVLKAVQEQVVSSDTQEPYPQYLADLMAKSISGGLEALRTVVQSEISSNPTLLKLITQSYRTY